MHIHGASYSQFAARIPTQSAQQATVMRRASAEVRRKLAGYAAEGGADAVTGVDAYTPGERRRESPAEDLDAFRTLFRSIKI